MNLILYLSEAVIPILVLLIVGNGLMHRQHVYEDFLEGAKSGIRTAVEIMPTLIGLMAAVGILRASGFLDFISGCCCARMWQNRLPKLSVIQRQTLRRVSC